MEPYRYLGLLRGGVIVIGRAAGGRALNAMVRWGALSWSAGRGQAGELRGCGVAVGQPWGAGELRASPPPLFALQFAAAACGNNDHVESNGNNQPAILA